MDIAYCEITGSQLAERLVFIYCPVILLKMGWFENKPHLFSCNVVIKFLYQQFLATINTATCEQATFSAKNATVVESWKNSEENMTMIICKFA